jgi:hypothetical protein
LLKNNSHRGGAFEREPNYLAIVDELAQLPETGAGLTTEGGMDGNIFNSSGDRVGMVLGPAIFDLRDQRIYDLKGTNIYKLSGELVGHLPLDVRSFERRLDKSTDKLFRDG